MASSSDASDRRNAILAKAWDGAAEGYDAYFSKRFAPFIQAALEGLRSLDSPPGPVLVPCCGPGREVLVLAQQFPDRKIVGVDLSRRMLELASELCAVHGNVELEQADACGLDKLGLRAAGVLSTFGLQQLSDPAEALENWTRVLLPGGGLAVLFWPAESEDVGPFATQRKLLDQRLGRSDTTWEGKLRNAISAGGGTLVQDSELRFPMSHESAESVWEALVESGPLRSVLVSRGPEFIKELRQQFLGALPPGPIEHRPKARLLLAKRATAKR